MDRVIDRIVDYYFTPQSPWTYLGHQRFADLVARCDAEVRVKPVDMGRVFAVSGGLPLAQRPRQRQSYRLIELARFAEHLGIPLNLHPKFFPVACNVAARRIIAATEATDAGVNARVDNSAAMRLAGAMMRAVWVEERNIADEDTLDAIASECGLDAPALRDAGASSSNERRKRTRPRSQSARSSTMTEQRYSFFETSAASPWKSGT